MCTIIKKWHKAVPLVDTNINRTFSQYTKNVVEKSSRLVLVMC